LATFDAEDAKPFADTAAIFWSVCHCALEQLIWPICGFLFSPTWTLQLCCWLFPIRFRLIPENELKAASYLMCSD